MQEISCLYTRAVILEMCTIYGTTSGNEINRFLLTLPYIVVHVKYDRPVHACTGCNRQDHTLLLVIEQLTTD